MRPEHDVAGNSPRLAEQHLWSAEDDMASEVEVREFLYGLIRAVKPRRVVETGSYTFGTAEVIARALQANGFGSATVCDCSVYPRRMPPWIASVVDSLHTQSQQIMDLIAGCDLLFSDSDPKVRPEEVSWLKPGAIAVVHDTYVHPHLGEFVKSQGGILFDTPRGFGIIRR